MSLYNVKISKKGQITIPKELREKYNLNGEIEIILISTFKSILLKSKSRSLSQLQILFR
jgi:AbrB family looped-hinge helix DNA binding protein